MPLTSEQIKMYQKKYGIDPNKVRSLDTKPPVTTDFNEWRNNLLGNNNPQDTVIPTRKEGFIEGTKSALGERANALKETAQQTMSGEITPVETGIQTVGQVLGGVGDVIGQTVKAVTPDFIVNKATAALGETPVGKLIGEVAPKVAEKYKSFSEAHPRLTKNIESTANIAAALPIGAESSAAKEVIKDTAKSTLKGAKNIVSDVASSALEKAGGVYSKNIDTFIDKSIEKSVKPSVAGKETMAAQNSYKQKARDAIKEIVSNKKNLDLDPELPGIQLPENIAQTQKAIAQTKQNIFKQYSEMAQKAGQKQAKVNLEGIGNELLSLADNKVLNDINPSIVNYAKSKAETFLSRKIYTPEEAQDAIKYLNQSLDAFYKNPTYESATKAMIDASIANNLRKGLDNVIEQAGQSGYQALKNKYGALSAIEKDVSKRAIMEGRKNAAGLLDFTDILSGGQMAEGLLSLNPAKFASGVVQKGIKKFIKSINSPDEIIKRMFKKVDKTINLVK
jgi:hypothetical protein